MVAVAAGVPCAGSAYVSTFNASTTSAFTFAAVKKYQAAHGVYPQSGFVGPLTRGVLNLGMGTLQSLQLQVLTLQAAG